MMSTTTEERPAPSQTRSTLDHLYEVLKTHDGAPTVKQVQAVTGLTPKPAGELLAAVTAVWSAGVKRTEFRDRLIAAAVAQAGEAGLTMRALEKLVPASGPQLYTSLARLQVAGRVSAVRDGTRTPSYVAS